MENQSEELTPPEDLAGYQHIVTGRVEYRDIVVDRITRRKAWANESLGRRVEDCASDIYRKMECPKHEGQTKFEIPNGSRIPTEQEKADLDQRIKNTRLVSMPTGSLRENKKGKGRFDLIPYEPTRQLAIHFETGGAIHGDRNWELGQPLSTYLNSAKRHAAQAGNLKDENHAISSCWNFFCLIQTAKWIEEGKLPKELDDINWLKK